MSEQQQPGTNEENEAEAAEGKEPAARSFATVVASTFRTMDRLPEPDRRRLARVIGAAYGDDPTTGVTTLATPTAPRA